MAEVAGYARDMRCNPTEPEKRLWKHLSRSQLAGHKFRRQAEIGPFIVDFFCPQKAFAVEVDGETHDVHRDFGRDKALGRLGVSVFHVTNPDVMNNMEGVLTAILGALEATPDRWERPHPNPSPEGEELKDSSLLARHYPNDLLISGFDILFQRELDGYDQRYARAVGKWALNASNAARFCYPYEMPDSLQAIPQFKIGNGEAPMSSAN